MYWSDGSYRQQKTSDSLSPNVALWTTRLSVPFLLFTLPCFFGELLGLFPVEEAFIFGNIFFIKNNKRIYIFMDSNFFNNLGFWGFGVLGFLQRPDTAKKVGFWASKSRLLGKVDFERPAVWASRLPR